VKGDRVFVRPEPLLRQKMMGGLHLPDSVMEEKKFLSKFRVGVVIGIGPGMRVPGEMIKRFPMETKIGERVVYHERLEANKIFMGGEGFVSMGDGDILCYLSKDAVVVQQVIKPAGVPG